MSYHDPTPSLRNSIFWGVARIVVSSVEGPTGIEELPNPDIGALFLIMRGKREQARTYLITARHVIERASDASIIFSAKTDDGGYKPFEVRVKERFHELWHSNPDPKIDSAILRLKEGTEVHRQIAEAKAKPVLMPMAGYDDPNAYHRPINDFEEVFFVGYPEGIWDRQSGLPIVRRGISATPTTGRYNGEPAFLIDGAVHKGCSGGPVVVISREIVIPSGYADPNASTMSRIHEAETFHLLGMIVEVFNNKRIAADGLNLGVVLRIAEIYSHISFFEELTGR